MDQAYGRENGGFEPSNAAIPSQAGMPPMSPMNPNGRTGQQASQQLQIGNGNGVSAGQVEHGDFAEERRGGNKFLNFFLCRC
jgi:casein kinase 1